MKQPLQTGLGILILVLLLFGLAQQSTIQEEITRANEQFMSAFNAGDAQALAELYTEDALLLPPNSDFAEGKDAIRDYWQAVMDAGVAQAQLEIREVEQYGDVAHEVSTYTLFDAEGQEVDRGKYIVIWQRVDGEWKLHRDIFNSSMAADEG